MENLDKITHTIGGYPIKELRYKKQDNIFVGRVQDPICGRPNLHDGYVTCVWRKSGKVDPRYGVGRTDLEIDLKLLR
jgi:hypothetical protein